MRISLRTAGIVQSNTEYMNGIFDAITEHNRCFDEIWFATSYGILSKEAYEADADNISLLAEICRKKGILPSLQVSRTVGHHEDSLKYHGNCDAVSDFDTVTSIDGISYPGVFCWNNSKFREYFCELIKTYMRFNPYRIWPDDDIRLRLIGPSKALCFCDNCIDIFNRENNLNLTRAQLKEKFMSDMEFRKKYVDFQTKSLASFVFDFTKAAYSKSPESVMSLQNGGNTMLAINAQRATLDAMKKASGNIPAFRAGGGFYNDHAPADMFPKALTLNYMNERLPEYVTERSCEIENLPFSTYGKSPECTLLEAALYVSYGCNELSITLMNTNEPLCFHKRVFKRIEKYRPYLEKCVKQNENTHSCGIRVFQPEGSNFVPLSEDKHWNDTCIWEYSNQMRMGLPLHTGTDNSILLLSSKACDYLTDSDFELLTKSTVVTDAYAIAKLMNSKYADKLEVFAKELDCKYKNGVNTVLCDNLKNSDMKTYPDYPIRPTPDAYYEVGGKNFIQTAYHVHTLTGKNVGSACGVATLSTGAKWVISSTSIRQGTMALCERDIVRCSLEIATGKPLCAYVNDLEQITLVPRNNSNGKTVSVFLLNCSLTETEEFEVAVLNPDNTDKCTLIDPYAEDKEIPLINKNGRYYVTVPKMAPYRCVTLLF